MKNKLTKNQIYFIPIALLVLLLPLVVRFGIYETGIANEPWNTVGEYSTDLYLYNKSKLFNSLSLIMLILMLADWESVKKMLQQQKKIWRLLGCYCVLVIISSLASEYPLFALQGAGGQFESVFVLLGYILVGLYCAVYCRKKEIYNKLPHLFFISSIILGLLGCLQISGNDPFYTKFVQSLCIPADVLEASGGIQFRFENNRVYLTLYNSNYAGVYCTCMISILLSLLLSEKQRKRRILYAVALSGMIISLIGSGSKTGLLVTAFLCVCIFLAQKQSAIKKAKTIIFGSVIIFAGGIFLLRFAPQGTVQGLISGLLPKKTEYDLKEAYTDQEGIHFLYQNTEFCVSMVWSDKGLTVGTSGNNISPIEIVQVTDGTAHFLLHHKDLPDIPVSFVNYNDIVCMQLQFDDKLWIVTDQLAQEYLFLNPSGYFVPLTSTETSMFTNYPTWLSYRGYIWARTIPLLKENFFLGGGPDSFVMLYPNDDYLGRHQTKTEQEYTSRPHNWYLQIATQTGVPSLICMMIAFLLYLKNAFRMCLKSETNITSECKAYLFGSISFLLMAIINDSSIGITPIFWVMFGSVMAYCEK